MEPNYQNGKHTLKSMTIMLEWIVSFEDLQESSSLETYWVRGQGVPGQFLCVTMAVLKFTVDQASLKLTEIRLHLLPEY